jgi:hypothetical protein
VDSRAQTLIRDGDQLFTKRLSFMSLLQEIADNFYVERADFTASRSHGSEFASHLATSYPLLARRELANAFGSMLRPRGQEWFRMGLERQDREDNEGKRWLEWATGVQRRVMFDRRAMFDRATNEGDNDFAAFGQCVISAELNRDADGMLYRSWHLRDVAWCESYDGSVGARHRKWKPTARQLAGEFRPKADGKQPLHARVIEMLDKDPYGTVNCRHAVIPAEDYDSPSSKADYEYVKPGVRKWKTKWVSVYLDTDNNHVIEEVGVHTPVYVIPRWQTVSGSQYAYSPATVAALPDARLMQAITATLLEAGEKAVNPPMIAVQEMIRSDISVYAGGITWVDAEYDQKMGDVLRPISQDKGGLGMGMEMQDRARQMVAEAFYLNKLSLPVMAGSMTATEVSQRVQEYIRNALPLFGPMESEYNGALCDQTFEILLRAGAFGSIDDMPQSLRGQEVQFRFESPLHEAAERQKGQTFMEAKAMLAQAAELDPSVTAMVDSRTALRDVLNGIGTPARWLRDEAQMQEMDASAAEQQQAQQMLAMMGQGATVAEQIGNAGVALQQMTGM